MSVQFTLPSFPSFLFLSYNRRIEKKVSNHGHSRKVSCYIKPPTYRSSFSALRRTKVLVTCRPFWAISFRFKSLV